MNFYAKAYMETISSIVRELYKFHSVLFMVGSERFVAYYKNQKIFSITKMSEKGIFMFEGSGATIISKLKNILDLMGILGVFKLHGFICIDRDPLVLYELAKLDQTTQGFKKWYISWYENVDPQKRNEEFTRYYP